MSESICPCGSTLEYAVCCGNYHAELHIPPDAEALMRSRYRLGLEVRAHRVLDTDRATVEFVARYKLNGRAHRLHEISRFERIDGRWLYVDGEQPA